nr:MAG TPA: hypothetical protein [Caudoviricetes sp.]
MTVRYHHSRKWRCLPVVKAPQVRGFLWVKTDY